MYSLECVGSGVTAIRSWFGVVVGTKTVCRIADDRVERDQVLVLFQAGTILAMCGENLFTYGRVCVSSRSID